ncbi:MAG: sugar kinase [Actinomycetia bacterium]|nr:sugar kinase [Actinomycetes bacterium]
MSKRVITFGEIMLRLMPRGNLRFLQEGVFEASFGGGEANVAVELAGLGLDAGFFTLLPDNEIADACVGELRRFGVDTSSIVRKPGRIGVYYAENGTNQRPSKIIYDRAGSVLAAAGTDDADFESVLDGWDWLHITGITPAISASAAELTFAAASTARRMGLVVSCDLNYRAKLWRYGKNAPEVMRPLAGLVDVLLGNEEDIEKCLGIAPSGVDVASGRLDVEQYECLARRVFAEYPNLRALATSLRESISASHNDWSACLYDGAEFVTSRKYRITDIVDRVGSGDAFAGGVIYGFSELGSPAEIVEFAAAAGALSHTIRGDFNRVTRQEVLALAAGDGSGRVQR